MGIVTGLLGGSMLSGVLGNKSAKAAANAQAQGADRATAAQLEMFNKQMELMQPYMNAGQSGIAGLQGLVNQQRTPFSFSYDDYFKSPEYAALSQQQERQALGNASATGGLRSGNSQVALAAIAPQLAQQGRQNAMNEYSLNQASGMDEFNQRMGLVGLGLGSAQQVSSAAGQFGQQAGNNAMYAGNAMANKYNQYNQNMQGLLGDAGAVGMRLFGGF